MRQITVVQEERTNLERTNHVIISHHPLVNYSPPTAVHPILFYSSHNAARLLRNFRPTARSLRYAVTRGRILNYSLQN